MSDYTPRGITPADQRIAAEIAASFIDQPQDVIDANLIALAATGMTTTISVAAVLGRNLVSTLVATNGIQDAKRILEMTALDAAVADDDVDGISL